MNAVFFLICLLNDHCHSKIAVTAVTGPPLETHGDSPKMNAETWQGSPTVRGWLDSCQYAHAVVMCPLLNVSFSSILPTCFLAQVCVCVIPCLSCLVNQVSRAENFPTLHVQKWSCTPKMTSTLTANPHFSWARDKPTSQSYVAWVSCAYKNDFLASMGWFREQLQEHIWVWLETG